MATIAERSEVLAKDLNKARMQATPYKTGPMGSRLLAFRVPDNGKSVRVWAGGADVGVMDRDTQHRQALVFADEASRDVGRTYTLDMYQGNRGDDGKYSRRIIERTARAQFPIWVPGRPKFRLDSWEVTGEHAGHWGNLGYDRVRVHGTMTVGATESTMLVGLDETAHFVCALPSRVDTVQDAHELLRPAGVPKGSLRQGEWFLVPATKAEVEEIIENLGPSTRIGRSMERESSHRALVVKTANGDRFTIGEVSDDRTGRHKSLHLDRWHKIIRNTEIVVRNVVQRRYWD